MGSFVWRVGYELKMPIGSIIFPTLHDPCFRRSNGQSMIVKLHLFSSCGRSHLENLSFWRRHFMVHLFGRVAWATLEGHNTSAQVYQQPHNYHKWREKPLGWEDPISPCGPNTLSEPGVEDLFELNTLAHFIWMIAWVWKWLIGNNIPHVHHHSYLEEAIEKQRNHHLYLPFSHDVHFAIFHLEGIIGGKIHCI